MHFVCMVFLDLFKNFCQYTKKKHEIKVEKRIQMPRSQKFFFSLSHVLLFGQEVMFAIILLNAWYLTSNLFIAVSTNLLAQIGI